MRSTSFADLAMEKPEPAVLAIEKPEEARPPGIKAATIGIRLGGTFQLTGIWAIVVLMVLLLLLIWLGYLFVTNTQPTLWASALLWLLFIAYWSAAAKDAAQARSSESTSSRQLHQLLMYGALLIAFLPVPGLTLRWLRIFPWVGVAVGLTVQIASALFAVWARQHLGRNWSGAITAKVDHQLIRTGPYRLVRHPIYTGMVGMFAGTALVSGELHGLVAVVIICVAYWRKIRLEEAHLRTIFGAEYDEYRRKSWALIPGLV